MIAVKVRREGDLLRKLAERANNPRQLLAQFGGYLRAAAQARILSGEGMAPWAESTRRKYEQQGMASVTAAGNVRASYARKLDTYLRRKGHDEARDELRRLMAGQRVASSSKPIERLQKRLDRAKDARAKGRQLRQKRKAESHTLLGRMWATFGMRVEGKARAVVRNYTSFSAIQNDGGVAGHGAVIPERKFLEITARARRWMAEKTLDFLLRGN